MMKMLTSVCLLGIFCGLAMAASALLPTGKGDDRAKDREIIRAHIDKIFRAYMKKDRATVRATHAADWRGFIRPSRAVIKGIDQYMREAEPILSGPAEVADYRLLEFDVIFYGDTAVVSYIASMEWQVEGVRFPDALRVLDVYAKQGGHWNQVASNVASHPDALAAARQQPQTLTPGERRRLLTAREAVWRSYFANDRAKLDAFIPEDTIAINAAEERWADRKAILAGAKEFAEGGGKLTRLDFPQTEIRVYGDVAILYTTYSYEIESRGQRHSQSGRGTEIFVRRGDSWVNPGWHLDSGK